MAKAISMTMGIPGVEGVGQLHAGTSALQRSSGLYRKWRSGAGCDFGIMGRCSMTVASVPCLWYGERASNHTAVLGTDGIYPPFYPCAYITWVINMETIGG